MADLIDTGPWPAGIYQLEETDPVLGGTPNVATGAGMSNIPHLQLAQRTKVLKDLIDATGLGAASVPLVTLNSAAARLTGMYRFASSDPNTPAAGATGTVQVIAASTSGVTQIAYDFSGSRMWTRQWNGTIWGNWNRIWHTTGVAEALTTNGWQRLPSGLVLQWGQAANIAPATNVTVTLPIAFPAAALFAICSLADFANDRNALDATYVRGLSLTALTLRNSGSVTMSVLWLAIGI